MMVREETSRQFSMELASQASISTLQLVLQMDFTSMLEFELTITMELETGRMLSQLQFANLQLICLSQRLSQILLSQSL